MKVDDAAAVGAPVACVCFFCCVRLPIAATNVFVMVLILAVLSLLAAPLEISILRLCSGVSRILDELKKMLISTAT